MLTMVHDVVQLIQEEQQHDQVSNTHQYSHILI